MKRAIPELFWVLDVEKLIKTGAQVWVHHMLDVSQVARCRLITNRPEDRTGVPVSWLIMNDGWVGVVKTTPESVKILMEGENAGMAG
jgi:hypothetical protein